MKYDATAAQIFTEVFAEAARSARNLESSLRRGRSQGWLPVAEDASPEEFDEDTKDHLDAFRARFCDLQDALGRKVFRSLLFLEQEAASEATMLDVINAMEKRGLISGFERWSEVREVRNALSHDYPKQGIDRVTALNRALELAPDLLDALERTRHYVENRIGLELPKRQPPS